MPLPGGFGFGALCLCVLVASRSFSARENLISDCDESMNFYEPTHYLLHGTGLQTWEYSPRFALRSYLYLRLHALPSLLLRLTKLPSFHSIRSLLALLSATSESLLLSSSRRRFGAPAALCALAFLAGSPGMFSASTAFLPSSFAMCCLSFAAAALLARRTFPALLCLAAAVLVGWPFSGLAFVPVCLALLFGTRFKSLVAKGLCAGLAVGVPLVAVDSFEYGKLVVAPWNIVVYNVLKQPEGGSALYGVEPWHWYLLNGAVNLNVAWLLALAVFPLVVLSSCFLSSSTPKQSQPNQPKGKNQGQEDKPASSVWDLVLVGGPVFLWVGFMSVQAHKEERFLFVVYPLICVAAGIALARLSRFVSWITRARVLGGLLVCGTLLAFAAVSASRVAAVLNHYSSSQSAWEELGRIAKPGDSFCVGKEWYRFPSHFFLPGNSVLKFVRSNFTGELPQPFGEHPWDEPRQKFNDRNRMEPERYVSDETKECKWLVDLEFDGQSEVKYSVERKDVWEVAWEGRFLDAGNTRSMLDRALWIPGRTGGKKWAKYLVLRNRVL